MYKPARWILPQIDTRGVEALAAALQIHAPAARVLVARGYGDPAAARRFLKPSLDDLNDPFLMRDMDRAAGRLRDAIAAHEKILLYGDYDVDGTSAIVIVKKAIELAGGQAGFHVPHRLKDGYGMRAEVIEEAARDNVKLIVSVDTGIRALEVVRRASELGIDVIVTDHHLPESELPPALAVLNPNRPGCPYPDKMLCGAGVALKLAQALFQKLEWPEAKRRRFTESFLKIAAIATVADVVPLVGENRIIVKQGLEGLRDVRNPGLRALMDVAGLVPGERPSAGQVAFRIAPRINAAGRMANANDVIDLFLTDDKERARELAAQMHTLNQERQQTESEITHAILEDCERIPVTDGQMALVFSGHNWHRGVVGIVASRLVERFHRPVIVLSEDEETSQAQGSGRSIPAFHLLEALESMPDLFTRFGGHQQAAGLGLPIARVAEFRERLNTYAAKRLTPEDLRPQLDLDAVLSLDEVTDEAVNEILAMAPFGHANPAPLFALTGVEVFGEPVVWREKNLRVRLRAAGRVVVAKAWNFAGRSVEFRPGGRIDTALSFEEDNYALSRGFPGWSATIRDVHPAQ